MIMKEKFFKLIHLIKSNTSLEIEEFEDECDYHFHIYANDDCYWISLSKDEKEVAVGFGYAHRHFNYDEYTPEKGLKHFSELISHNLIKTSFLRGNRSYRTKIEIQYPNRAELLADVSFFYFNFWQKRSTVTKTIPAVIRPDILNK